VYGNDCLVGQGATKRSMFFCLSPSFWHQTQAGSVVKDQAQAEEAIDNDGGETDVKCEPVPAELASKNVIT